MAKVPVAKTAFFRDFLPSKTISSATLINSIFLAILLLSEMPEFNNNNKRNIYFNKKAFMLIKKRVLIAKNCFFTCLLKKEFLVREETFPNESLCIE